MILHDRDLALLVHLKGHAPEGAAEVDVNLVLGKERKFVLEVSFVFQAREFDSS